MNGKIISAICFKLFAIYFIVSTLIALPTIWGAYLSSTAYVKTMTIPIILAVTTVLVAWFIVQKLWKLGSSVIQEFPNTERVEPNIEEVLYSVLGVFFLISAISQLPISIISVWSSAHQSPLPISYYAQLFFGPLVELIAGSFLTFKAKGLSNALTKLRHAGT